MVPDLDLERLFSEHAQPLYGFLAYRVGDPTVAEDLLGDTFERVVKSHARYNARKGSESTWIYTIALNCLRDHVRRSQAEGRALERADWPDDAFGRESHSGLHDRDELLRALGALEPAEREIVALRYGADLRLQDIATVTGLAPTTVQGRLYSGLRKLRQRWSPDGHHRVRRGRRSAAEPTVGDTSRCERPVRRAGRRSLADFAASGPRILLALVPAALTVYFGFRAGGFFVGATAGIALFLLLLLAARVLAPLVAEGLNRTVLIAIAGMALFSLWTLLSGRWSHAPGARARGVRSRARVHVGADRVRPRPHVAAPPALRWFAGLRSRPSSSAERGSSRAWRPTSGRCAALREPPAELPDHVLERVRAARGDRDHDVLRADRPTSARRESSGCSAPRRSRYSHRRCC